MLYRKCNTNFQHMYWCVWRTGREDEREEGRGEEKGGKWKIGREMKESKRGEDREGWKGRGRDREIRDGEDMHSRCRGERKEKIEETDVRNGEKRKRRRKMSDGGMRRRKKGE